MIRLRIKSVDCKEQVKDLEAPSEWTVADLKREIGRSMRPYPSVDNQRLIHSGKLLKDESVLGSFLSNQEAPHHVHLAIKNGKVSMVEEPEKESGGAGSTSSRSQNASAVPKGPPTPSSQGIAGAEGQGRLAQEYLLQIYNHYYHYVLYYNAYINALQGTVGLEAASSSSTPEANIPPPQPPAAAAAAIPAVAEDPPAERRRDGLELIYMSIQLFIFSCMVYFNSSGTRILFVILVWLLFYFFKRHNEAQRVRDQSTQVTPAVQPPPREPRNNDGNEEDGSDEELDPREEEGGLLRQGEAHHPPQVLLPPPANQHFLQQILSIFVSFFASLIPEPQPLHG